MYTFVMNKGLNSVQCLVKKDAKSAKDLKSAA